MDEPFAVLWRPINTGVPGWGEKSFPQREAVFTA